MSEYRQLGIPQTRTLLTLWGFLKPRSNMAFFSNTNRIVALAASLLLCNSSLSQVSQKSQEDQDEAEFIRTRIESIVTKSAAPIRLNGNSPGITIASGQIVIAEDGIQEIRKYGKNCIPILSIYLLGEGARKERVAMRLLGAIGGASIVDPLVTVLDKSSRPASREDALRSLHNAPCSLTVARTMLRVARNDPNKTVRDLAEREVTICSVAHAAPDT